MSAKRLFLFFLLTACCSCAGCATTRHPVVPSGQPPGQPAVVISSAEEVQVGRSMAREIVAPRYAPWNNSVEQRRVNDIGRRLAAASDRRDIIYSFQILDSPDDNAFALPGGYVYIFRGLYEKLDEGGLAAVLAHQIAHVAARHVLRHMQSTLGDEVLVGLVLAGLGRKDPEVARQIAGASDAVFDLLGRGYSRQEELQADALAVKYLTRAGYDPYALAGVLESLMKEKGKTARTFEMLNAPVRTGERIRKIRQEADAGF